MTNKFQTTVWEGKYFPFGELYTQNVSEPNAFRFPGQYDDNSGMYYNWHRYYDSKQGRYLQSGPIGVAGGLNLYAYAGGNAVRMIDENGLSPTFGSCLENCVLAHYGLTDIALRVGVGLGALPVPKSLLNIRVISNASKITNPVSLIGHYFPNINFKLGMQIWNTNRLWGLLGRLNLLLGVGLVAYDITSISMCVDDCLNNGVGCDKPQE